MQTLCSIYQFHKPLIPWCKKKDLYVGNLINIINNKSKRLNVRQNGKNMVRWLMFDIFKSPQFTLITILAFKIIIKL
jgi:hypothetical protein